MAQGLVYSISSKGGRRFSGTLSNVSDPDNPVDVSLAGVRRYLIKFWTPSRKVIERDASVNPTADTSDDNEIYFDTTPNDPIFPEGGKGYWEYTIGIERINDQVSYSPFREGFHVID